MAWLYLTQSGRKCRAAARNAGSNAFLCMCPWGARNCSISIPYPIYPDFDVQLVRPADQMHWSLARNHWHRGSWRWPVCTDVKSAECHTENHESPGHCEVQIWGTDMNLLHLLRSPQHCDYHIDYHIACHRMSLLSGCDASPCIFGSNMPGRRATRSTVWKVVFWDTAGASRSRESWDLLRSSQRWPEQRTEHQSSSPCQTVKLSMPVLCCATPIHPFFARFRTDRPRSVRRFCGKLKILETWKGDRWATD